MAKNKMLPENELPKICKFCESAVPLIDETYVLCRKFGTVQLDHKCKRFVYDPLKHIPSPPVKIIIPDDEELIF